MVLLTKEEIILAKKIRLYKKNIGRMTELVSEQNIPRLSRGVGEGAIVLYQFLRRGERTGMKIANYIRRRKRERVVHDCTETDFTLFFKMAPFFF